MKKFTFLLLITIFTSVFTAVSQENAKKIIDNIEVPSTCIKSQYFTGTCWNFSTLSFIESELLRETKLTLDLSEKFVVRYNFLEKAIKYVRVHGNLNFSQGSQAHNAIQTIKKYGIVPELVYPMLKEENNTKLHAKLNNALKGMLDSIINNSNGRITNNYKQAIEALLDEYLGEIPSEFKYKGANYNPKSFSNKFLLINLDDYIDLTSLDNEPHYKLVNLDLPDNWRGELYYNVPIDELVEIVDNSINNGNSLVWDGDVTNNRYDVNRTIYNINNEDDFSSQDSAIHFAKSNRQLYFDTWQVTDDHLIHLIGLSHDANGNIYYKFKDSG
ncbi:MAG: aminopeptidase [bacterium]|nr:aminopeptidase [bacterium]